MVIVIVVIIVIIIIATTTSSTKNTDKILIFYNPLRHILVCIILFWKLADGDN